MTRGKQIDTLAIVGVGLIGGSIGLATKQRGVAKRVVGVGRRESSLNEVRRRGIIDQAFLQIPPAVAEADFVVFCTPVQTIANQVLEAAPHCKHGCLLTDAGSTKVTILDRLEGRLPNGVHFVGSHPLAGSEKRGPEHADANLFQGRLTVLTPMPTTDSITLERVSEFWQSLGSRVKVMPPEEHDKALAVTSHVPHLIAAALAGTLPAELHELTATGFRDTTRIAAGDPDLWTGIFLHNRQAVLEALSRITTQLKSFREAIAEDDEEIVRALLDQAKRVRDALGS